MADADVMALGPATAAGIPEPGIGWCCWRRASSAFGVVSRAPATRPPTLAQSGPGIDQHSRRPPGSRVPGRWPHVGEPSGRGAAVVSVVWPGSTARGGCARCARRGFIWNQTGRESVRRRRRLACIVGLPGGHRVPDRRGYGAGTGSPRAVGLRQRRPGRDRGPRPPILRPRTPTGAPHRGRHSARRRPSASPPSTARWTRGHEVPEVRPRRGLHPADERRPPTAAEHWSTSTRSSSMSSFPAGSTGWRAIYQSNRNNGERQRSFFVNAAHGIGISGVYEGNLTAGAWHRGCGERRPHDADHGQVHRRRPCRRPDAR